MRAGAENREPAFVAVGANHLAALRDAVGAGAPGVTWADTRKWHPNSSTRLRAFHEYVTERVADGATRIRLIGEPEWYEARPDLIREWTRYESVLNMVLATLPVSVVCTYDTSRLDPAIVANARRTQPVVCDGEEAPSPDFLDPAELLRTWNPEPPPPPAWAPSLDRPADLSTARLFVREEAMRAGVTFERATNMAMAANEILRTIPVPDPGRWAGGRRSVGRLRSCRRSHGRRPGTVVGASARGPDPDRAEINGDDGKAPRQPLASGLRRSDRKPGRPTILPCRVASRRAHRTSHRSAD